VYVIKTIQPDLLILVSHHMFCVNKFYDVFNYLSKFSHKHYHCIDYR